MPQFSGPNVRKKKKESLFHGGGDPKFNVQVNAWGSAKEQLPLGYLEAARQLTDAMRANPRGAECLIYPLVFLYRHWLELRLKLIIDQGRQLLREGLSKSEDYLGGHRLHNLWPVALEIIEAIWSGSKRSPYFDGIKFAVGEFRKFDPDSQSFRYPFDRQGENSLESLPVINIEHFTKQMNAVAAILDEISEHIDHNLSAQNEGNY